MIGDFVIFREFRILFTKHKTLCDSVCTFNRHIIHLSKGVHDKCPHLTQYLPITKSVPVVTDTRITRANRDQIEYIPLLEDTLKPSKTNSTLRSLIHWRLLTQQPLDAEGNPGGIDQYLNLLKPDADEHDHSYDLDEFRLKRTYQNSLYMDYHYHFVRFSKRPCVHFDYVFIE
ncbi:hypothetical protein RCL_jg19819.t1 [Rhizophagus clarus]|uniref:Uncharacterized protein n=1 Tax=Rhizophagus clarus TaxID=94130 RepID=A0A8H3LBV5_9GLOM|nr:hypothetical protein RCL_jg19819.t1 [Rhizophagus clarus]